MPEAEQEMQDRSARLINVLHPKKQTSEQRQIFEHMFEAYDYGDTFGNISHIIPAGSKSAGERSEIQIAGGEEGSRFSRAAAA